MFAATYIINLPRSTERWSAMQPILDAMAAPNPICFEALDGMALAEAAIAQLQESGLLAREMAGFDADCMPGEIGCALSHAAVLRDIVDKGRDSALILEDDVVLSGATQSWRRRFEKAFADLPASWELWYLYRCFDIQHRTRRVTRRTVVPWTPQGGAAYAVTLSGARKMLRALTPVASAVDRVYAELVQKREVNAWAASPLLILPGPHPSIINRNNPSKKWVEKGINRPPEYWPEEYLEHLGEVAPKGFGVQLWKFLSQSARFVSRRKAE